MPSLAQSGKPQGGSNRNLIWIGIVVVLLLCFFFLPEILSIGKSNKGGEEVEATPTQNIEIKEPVVKKEIAVTGLNRQQAEPDVFERANWDTILDRVNIRRLKKELKKIKGLESSLIKNVRGKRSQEILVTYFNDLNKIVNIGEDSFESPQKAVGTLYKNEIKLTKMLVREKVDRASRILWHKIDLGPELQIKKSLKMKAAIVPSFKPRPMLDKVQIYQKSDSKAYDSTKFLKMTIEGHVVGQDVESIEFLPVSKRLKATKVFARKASDINGNRKFTLSTAQPPRNEVFILRIKDIAGNFYYKSYQFYPRIQAFPWKASQGGLFKLPYKKGDPRLDAYFAIKSGSSSPSKSSQSSSFFGGSSGSTF